MEHFASTPDGLLLAANGIDPVLAWDGSAAEMVPAGLKAPEGKLTITADGLGEISGTYWAYTRFLDEKGNPSDLSPLSPDQDGVIFDEIMYVRYANVPVSSDPKVKVRQILRNTAGQAGVFYVDVDTRDLTSTSFTSTRTDTFLSAQEAVALFDSEGLPLANSHGVPPADKRVLAAHADRMFAAGEEEYKGGSVKLTFGSKVVKGQGTSWPATFAGRFLWAAGASQSYEVESVDVTAQALTLLETYKSVSSHYSSYAIRPPPAERRLVQFSEPGQPESWPARNAISVQEDGDDIVALMPMGSFLYIIERRHIYRITFQKDPLEDGFVFLGCNRGCASSRCFAVVDEGAYMLDEAGIYRFSGARDTEPVSLPLQDLFEPGPAPSAREGYRIRWEGARYFHAVYDYGTQTVRWFVCLSGTRYPRHAIVLNIQTKALWVEEYPVPIASSCTAPIEGAVRVCLGGPGGQVYFLDEGSLDLVDPVRGTVRGTVSRATPLSLADSSAAFGDDAAGAPLVLVTGPGRGQQRRVVRRKGPTGLTIDRPWSITPRPGDVYQLGGVRWRYRTGWFRWAPSEQQGPRRLEILYEPVAHEQVAHIYLYQDRDKSPVVWAANHRPADLSSIGTARGDDAMTGDLTGKLGFMQRRLDSHKELYIDGPRLFSWELRGVTNRDKAVIYQITLDGAEGPGR